MDKLDKLDCNWNELDNLSMSSMSWIKLYCRFDELAKLDCKLDELAKLRMSSMSWIS